MSTGSAIKLSEYDEIRVALRNPALSRSFDKRTWDEGNIRAGIVSISHGDEHRTRRRIENTQFRRERLFAYEKDLFPTVCDVLVGALPIGEPVDLLRVSGRMSMALSAKRTGIDHDRSAESLNRLVELALIFSKGSAILDILGDRGEVEAEVRAAYEDFDKEFFGSSYDRRTLAAVGGAASEDVLEVLIAAGIPRDVALRECAIFLQGGTTTSSHTVCSLFDLLWASQDAAEFGRRLVDDAAFAQRCVHETLRLRPTTPVIRRLAEEPTTVAGHRLEKGDTVLLDVRQAHRDPRWFGDEPERFDPERTVDPAVPLWGLAFGGGSHQCIGRSVAGGFPVGGDPEDQTADPAARLFGLIALQVQTLARHGLVPDPHRSPRLDDATDRGSRWATFPARVTGSVVR